MTRKYCSCSSIFSLGAGGVNLPSSLRALDIKGIYDVCKHDVPDNYGGQEKEHLVCYVCIMFADSGLRAVRGYLHRLLVSIW